MNRLEGKREIEGMPTLCLRAQVDEGTKEEPVHVSSKARLR